jgi:basic membrane protein A
MNRIRTARGLAAVFLSVLLLAAACSSEDETQTTDEESTPTEESQLTVGLALGGPPDDSGYFQSFADGLKAAEESLGVTGSVQGNLDTEEKRVDAVRNLASDNDIVVAAGAEMSDAMLTVAAEFPDVKFLSVTGEMDPELPNLASYYVRQGAPNAVGAAVMAEIAKPEKMGVIGGGDIPPTAQVIDATDTVASKLSPPATVTSTIIESFEDTAGAKQATTAMLDEQVTAIVAFVNTGLDGVIAALEDKGNPSGVYITAQIFPQCEKSDAIVGTALLNANAQMEQMISDAIEGDLPTEPTFFGIENPDIQSFALCPSYDTPENQAIVEEVTAAINDGTYGLPDGV